MSETASGRRRGVLIALGAVVLTAVIIFAMTRGGGDDEATPSATRGDSTTETPPTASESTETPEPSETPTPTSTASPTCEGPDTKFNIEGVIQESLLPDCGTTVVTTEEQEESGLDLGCGGTYPVILYKTTTSDAKTSICGVDSSGEDFRVVTRPDGGDVVDMRGEYLPGSDAFRGTDSGTTYTIQAYDGTLVISDGGSTSTQPSTEWISLDNEPDL